MPDVRVLTGASGILSAAHRSREGSMHGHTWEVTCWWFGCPDAVAKQAELADYLSSIDHTILPDELAWGEALAVAILHELNCQKVEVSRPLERIFAVAERVFDPRATRAMKED